MSAVSNIPALALIGTDTGVGKSTITAGLCRALRAVGQRVWLHKVIACGGWDGVSAEDGRWHRALAAEADDGQPFAGICPLEFPEACSPHLAAAAVGRQISVEQSPGQPPVVLIEGAGGLLAPLTGDRQGIAEILHNSGIPAIIVTRPNLGTLNHTALTVEVARQRGLPLLGLIINHHQPSDDSLAVRSAATELAAITGLPVLAEVLWLAGGSAAPYLKPLIQRWLDGSMVHQPSATGPRWQP